MQKEHTTAPSARRVHHIIPRRLVPPAAGQQPNIGGLPSIEIYGVTLSPIMIGGFVLLLMTFGL